jgi:hypothetical protein
MGESAQENDVPDIFGDYQNLQDSGKIAIDSEKKICWIYNPELVQRYLNNVDLKIR